MNQKLKDYKPFQNSVHVNCLHLFCCLELILHIQLSGVLCFDHMILIELYCEETKSFNILFMAVSVFCLLTFFKYGVLLYTLVAYFGN